MFYHLPLYLYSFESHYYLIKKLFLSLYYSINMFSYILLILFS